MKAIFSLRSLALTAAAAALTLGATGAAQAHGDNIYWSIGMSSPGVQVGVSSAPPVVMYPPVYVAPRPVVYMPAPVAYGPPGWRHHHGHRGAYPGYYGYERYGSWEREREERHH
jgi:hypothetical protein